MTRQPISLLGLTVALATRYVVVADPMGKRVRIQRPGRKPRWVDRSMVVVLFRPEENGSIKIPI